MEALEPARPRDLPVNAVLSSATASALLERFGRAASTKSVRAVLDDARSALRRGEPSVLNAEDVALQALLGLDGEDQSGLRPLLNLTGTVLHTNLARAVLADAAIESALAAMLSPVALQFDLSAGKRGERDDHLRVDALVAIRTQLGWSLLEETAPLVFDAARTPDAAAAGVEGKQSCSA
jgi:L-seryl-tRNA(Ser) seleniumtransferase